MEAGGASEILERARTFIRIEASGLQKLASQLNDHFCTAVSEILSSQGKVVVSGVGKSRLVGKNISDTLASTGTPSIALDPNDALHGGLGRIAPDDILLALNNSEETLQLSCLIACVRRIPIPVIAMTTGQTSRFAESADIVLDIGRVEESCPLDLTPTASTAAMTALGDALALVLLEQRGFTSEDFAKLHPAGSLGARLTHVSDVMRKDEKLPLIQMGAPLKDAIKSMYTTPGHPSAVLVVDDDNRLHGMLTTDDLRRVMRRNDGPAFETAIDKFMQVKPTSVSEDMMIRDVFEISGIIGTSYLPVVDHRQTLVGLLEIDDIPGAAPVPRGSATVRRFSVAS